MTELAAGWRRVTSFRRNRVVGVCAAAVLAVLVLAAVSAPLWVPHAPDDIAPADRLLDPSGEYWFGTDNFGRDIFSRVVYGGRDRKSVV